MRFYVLTSSNYKALLRHNDPEYSNIPKDETVVVINSLDNEYIEKMETSLKEFLTKVDNMVNKIKEK